MKDESIFGNLRKLRERLDSESEELFKETEITKSTRNYTGMICIAVSVVFFLLPYDIFPGFLVLIGIVLLFAGINILKMDVK